MVSLALGLPPAESFRWLKCGRSKLAFDGDGNVAGEVNDLLRGESAVRIAGAIVGWVC